MPRFMSIFASLKLIALFDRIKNLVAYCLDKYAWLLSLVLKINVVRLNKERYTRKVVHRFCRDNEDEVYRKVLETSLSCVLSDKQKRNWRSNVWRPADANAGRLPI